VGVLKHLQSLLERYHEENALGQTTPGICVMVECADRRWQWTSGLATVSQDAPFDLDAPLLLASVSKPIIAVELVRLHQQGKLDIFRDRVGARLGLSAAGLDTMPISCLLDHTSGIPDYLEHCGRREVNNCTEDEIIARIITLWTQTPHPTWSAGYSNSNYVLLGKILETVTQQDLASYLTEAVFRPYAMRNSTVWQECLATKPAEQYVWQDGLWQPVAVDRYLAGWGDGFVISTARDLMHWLRALSDGQILSPSAFRLLFGTSPPQDHVRGYGLGFGLEPVAGACLWHSGQVDGMSSLIVLCPPLNLRLVLLCNHQQRTKATWLSERVLALLVERRSQTRGVSRGGVPRESLCQP
jgi:D-alanyl-D-alanine carboxypeptidase